MARMRLRLPSAMDNGGLLGQGAVVDTDTAAEEIRAMREEMGLGGEA